MKRITEKLKLNSQTSIYTDEETELINYITIVWGMAPFNEVKSDEKDYNQNKFYWPIIDAIDEWIKTYKVKSVSEIKKIYWCGSDDFHSFNPLKDYIRKNLSEKDAEKFYKDYNIWYEKLDIYQNGKKIKISRGVSIIYNEKGILTYSESGDHCRVIEI